MTFFLLLEPLMLKLALGYARLAPVFYLLPFLNGNLLGSPLLKNSLILLVSLGFALQQPELAQAAGPLVMLGLTVSETVIGLCMGVMMALPFWLAHAMGSIIDNQRGATLSNTMDPVNGVETSEISNLFNLFTTAVFLQAGGMLWLLQCLEVSYRLFPLAGGFALNLPAMLGLLDQVVGRGLVLAAPIVACLFLLEVALGVLSRFSQQLNAFSLAMTVKSALAFFILLLYSMPVLRDLAALKGDAAAVLSLLQAVR
jgi:type III secretion protein T